MSPTPVGLSNFVGGPTSGIKTVYSTKMAYDPNGKKIYWIGCDHNAYQTFFVYDEAANAWTVQPQTPFGSATKHGYEHNTFDSGRGRFYHRPAGSTNIQRWDGSTGWTSSSYTSVTTFGNIAGAIEWFPELGKIILWQGGGGQGVLGGYDPVANSWTTYGSGSMFNGAGEYHNVAQYSRANKLVWFGGGNGSRKMWTLNASGAVAAAADIPAELGTVGPGEFDISLPVCSPVTGNFIVMRNSTTWYDYDPAGKAWSRRTDRAAVLDGAAHNSSNPTFGVIAAPILQYGVIVFIKAFNTGSTGAQMWVFKP